MGKDSKARIPGTGEPKGGTDRIVEAILGSQYFGIYVFDGEKFVYFNRAIQELTGYSAKELENMSAWELIVNSFDEMDLRHSVQRMKAGEKPSRFHELQIKRKDGSLMYGFFHQMLVEYDGKKAILGTVIDITEKKKYELYVEQHHKYEIITRLTSRVYYDFNNYLTVIRGYLSLMRESITPQDMLNDLLEKARQANEGAIQLISGLLPMLETQGLSDDDIPLNAVLDSSLKMVSGLMSERKISVNREVPEKICPIRGNYIKIEQVILNILMNAIEAMPDGGTIRIDGQCMDMRETDVINFRHLQNGRYVRILISDTGEGIDPKELSQIWEPFYTTKGASGQGLSIALGIVLAHRGDILVQSVQGRGTTVILYFPCF